MRPLFTYAFMVIQALYPCFIEGYRTFSMRELGSCGNKSVEINIESTTWNSSGILVPDFDNTFVPGLHCVLSVKPPFFHGVVVSIRYLDLQPLALSYTACHNYLQISPVEGRGTVTLCGYSFDEYEFKSFTSWGRTIIVFHTSNCSSCQTASFQLTFTAVRKGINRCFKKERRCHNGYCIWKGLACDGHNNCGDLSDEVDKNISQCGVMTSGESLGVILITIVVSLTLLVIAAYFRGRKISQQTGRLSQCRRTESTQTNSEQLHVEPSVNSASSTVSRLRTSCDSNCSNAGLLPSYSDVVDDPPPPYEELPSLPVFGVSCSVTVESNDANSSNMTGENLGTF